MSANMSHFMTRMICSLIFGAGLFILSAADASAHRIGYRPYYVHDHYVHARTMSFPGWLRRNREFQHWYRHCHYRLTRHMSWHRLYDVYRFERDAIGGAQQECSPQLRAARLSQVTMVAIGLVVDPPAVLP